MKLINVIYVKMVMYLRMEYVDLMMLIVKLFLTVHVNNVLRGMSFRLKKISVC